MASIFIATKNEIQSENFHLTESSSEAFNLVNHIDAISAIGEENNLKRLDEYVFTPTEQIIDFFRSTGASEEEIRLIEEANSNLWFEPHEGISLIQEYVHTILNYHTLSDTTKSQILPELIEFKKILEVCSQESNHWHFEYNM